jgi:alcohol dehydrogenase class IV
MLEGFQFHNRTRVLFGRGLTKELGLELSSYGPRKVLLVTEAFLGKIGLVDRIHAALAGSEAKLVATFDKVVPNSELGVVRAGIDLARSKDCDLVVALGGGSSMDTAKAINLVLTHGGDIMDYQGAQMLPGACHPLVAIPTTAGTGSEVSNAAVIHDVANKVKIIFVDNFLMPDIALLDPELTLSLPARVTAATGMDALTHAIESYVSSQCFPVADALALQATQMIGHYLLEVVRDGSNIEARGQMLVAACMAGMAFTQAGVGCVHAMSHSVGGIFGVPHGEGNSILLPAGMQSNLELCPARFGDLARALGARETRGLTPVESGQIAIERVRQLQVLLKEHSGLPTRLSEVGVDEARLPEVAAAALLDGAMIYNRRPLDEDQILSLLRESY